MPVWLSTTLSIIVAVVVLLVMITVHEFGHYIAGKIFKFKINEFAIGFGKPLYRRVGKNGEAFSIRLVPLGGFCAFEGEDSEEKPALAVAAEPIEGEESTGQEALPVVNDGSFTAQKPWKRLIVLFAGAFMNFLFSMMILIIAFLSYGQFMTTVRSVLDTQSGIASESDLFQEGDIILAVDGHSIYLNTDISKAVKDTPTGTYVDCEIVRNGVRQHVRVLYRDYRYEKVDENQEPTGEIIKSKGFGISIGTANYRFGFFESIGRSFIYLFRMFGETLMIPAKLITGIVGIDQIGGPISTITMTAQFAQMGFNYLLEITAMIGISLCVFNLFPLPALDGSRMLFTAIEWVRGKPINRKVESYIHGIGMILLFGLVITVDILHFVL